MRRYSLLAILVIAVSLVFGPVLVSNASQTMGRVIDDSTITAAVKAELAKDVRLGTLTGVEVNTTNGVVTLAGKVKNKDEKMAIEDVVRGIDGVKDIKDNLQVVS